MPSLSTLPQRRFRSPRSRWPWRLSVSSTGNSGSSVSDSSLRTSVIDRLSPRQLEKLSELEENFNAIVVEEMVVRHQRVRLLEETLKETRTALRKLELSLKPVESEPSEATSRLASEIVSMITATARPVFHPGILQEVIQQFNEFGPKHRLALQVHPT